MVRNEDIDADEAPSAAPAPKKKRLYWLILAVMASVLLTVAALYLMGIVKLGDKLGDQEAAKAAAPPVPPIYLNLDPPIVVNFEDHGDLRFLQVGLAIMTHDPKAVEAINFHMPRLRNSLILLLGSQQYESLSTFAGKEKLRAAMLDEVRKAMQAASGNPSAEALYFTNFVMQ